MVVDVRGFAQKGVVFLERFVFVGLMSDMLNFVGGFSGPSITCHIHSIDFDDWIQELMVLHKNMLRFKLIYQGVVHGINGAWPWSK